jgi:hypothetical protein
MLVVVVAERSVNGGARGPIDRLHQPMAVGTPGGDAAPWVPADGVVIWEPVATPPPVRVFTRMSRIAAHAEPLNTVSRTCLLFQSAELHAARLHAHSAHKDPENSVSSAKTAQEGAPLDELWYSAWVAIATCVTTRHLPAFPINSQSAQGGT